MLDKRAASLEASLKIVEEQRALLRRYLELEKEQTEPRNPLSGIAEIAQAVVFRAVAPEVLTPIGTIVRDALVAGPTTKEILRKKAEEAGHEAPARGIHAVLMNYTRLDFVQVRGEIYSLTDKGDRTLSKLAESPYKELEA